MQNMNIDTSRIEKMLSEADSLMLSNPSEALALLKKLQEEVSDRDQGLLRDIKFKLAQTENQLSEFDSAEKILLELYEYYQKSGYDKGLAKVSNELGNNYWARGNLNESLKYYLQSLTLLEMLQEFQNMCIPLNNIGQIYWYNQDFEKARASYLRSYHLAKVYCPQMQGDALTNLGILSAEEGEYEQSEEYYQRALKQYEENNNQANIALLQVNLALLYEDTGKDDLALKYHHQAIESYRKLNNILGEMHAMMNYAGYLISRHNNNEVLPILNRAYELAEELGAKNQIIQLYLHYRNYYKETGNIEKAYEYQEKYYDAEIERLDSENREKQTEILTRYETREKEKESALLRKQNNTLAEKNREIEIQSLELDIANQRLQKANLELGNRLDELMQTWHEQEIVKRGEENLDSINNIISGIAHQWKQPLNVIGLLIQNLIDAYEYKELNSQYFDKFQDQVYQQIKYMSEIVNDFAYGFREAQRENEFSLAHAVKMGRSLVEKSLEIENVQFKEELPEDFQIAGDESKFIQVLLVLLSNAMEVFQIEEQKNPQIIISAQKQKNWVRLEVFNTGKPVPLEILPHIFDVFFSTKSKESNTGLGLTLAKKIIEGRLHGEINCHNREDGVVFVILLPVQAAE